MSSLSLSPFKLRSFFFYREVKINQMRKACRDRLESDSHELCDRLSELPDSLIHTILSFLPMIDVVRTRRLSKRWKNLWTTIPCLNFYDYKFGLAVINRRFVDWALSCWKGTKLLKFGINFMFHVFPTSDLDSWLLFAIEKQVEELYVNLTDSKLSLDSPPEREYYAPQRLYSCSSIRKLSLISCNLKICEGVQWNQLKILTIETSDVLSDHVMSQILCGAPQLEVLNLRFFENSTFSSIRSSSLKMLKIDRSSVGLNYHIVKKKTMLMIWAPNLECLEFSGVSYCRCLLNVPSLSNAILRFCERGDDERYPCDYSFDDMDGDESDSGEFSLDKMVEQVFLSISHVEKVTLSDWCIKVLLCMKKKDMLVLFPNAKFLKLNVSAADEILGVLEMFPSLMMLILERVDLLAQLVRYHFNIRSLSSAKASSIIKVKASNALELETNFPSFSLLHLKTVEITWILRDTSINPVIEFLLKNARVLEKMVFRPRTLKAEPESLILVEEKVKSMPRSSAAAEVVIIKNGAYCI